MRITKVETIPILVPIKAGMTMKTAHGEHVDSPYVLVRVHTNQPGLVGLGEATVAPRWNGEHSRSAVATIEDILAPAIVGLDPLDRTAVLARMDFAVKLHPFTKAAIEMALWDIAGKSAGLPVYKLLGGKARPAVPIKMVVGGFPTAEAVKLAEKFLEWGVKVLKVKVGIDPAGDVERVKAIRKVAGPKVPIGIDANTGWTLAAARWALAQLKDDGLLFVEQPVMNGDPHLLAQVRQVSHGIPVLADESVFTLTDCFGVAAAHAADIVGVYPGKNGGIIPALEIIAASKSAGLACLMGSNLELGVGSAAMLHLGVASANIQSEAYPADIIGPLYHEFDVIREPLKLGPVVAEVPDKPGLGVELDEKVVERCRVK
jgi:L-alanine-DL-glutamate epimerase-like enolase superfamily enzyme